MSRSRSSAVRPRALRGDGQLSTKEGFAIVRTRKRSHDLLWGRVSIFADHRNLAYVVNPDERASLLLQDHGPGSRAKEDGPSVVRILHHAHLWREGFLGGTAVEEDKYTGS